MLDLYSSPVQVGVTNYSPRTTSLSVQRAADRRDSAEERFFRRLEAEVCGFVPYKVSMQDLKKAPCRTMLKQSVVGPKVSGRLNAAEGEDWGASPAQLVEDLPGSIGSRYKRC